VQCLSFGKADGLPTIECSGGFQPSGCQSRDGRLWFPTVKPIFYSEKSLGVLGKGVTKTQFARWHYISCLPAIFLRGLLLRISGWFTRSPVL
jgi:hypothetical protein